MNNYRVVVEFTDVDIEGMRFTNRVVDWVDARNAHMACLLIGAQFWTYGTDNITNVYAELETD